MSTGLTLLLIVALAYLATHVAFDWIARKLLIVSGAEYLLLGIILGPQVADLLTRDTIDAFAPLTTLALGWVGAIVGTQFYLPDLIRIRGIVFRLAFIEAFTTLAVVSGVLGLAFHWLFDLSPMGAAVPALALGAIGAASAPTGIEVVVRRLARRGPVVQQLQVATAIDAFVAIVVLGLLVCIAHPTLPDVSPFTATEWAVVTVGIGVVGGALFHLFLGSERNTDRLAIALGGAIILASGAAAHMQLSPLLPAMIIGAILVNTSPTTRDEIVRTLIGAERPFYFVLLIFCGAAWQPSVRAWWIAPVVLFLVARTAAKIGGARLATRANGLLPTLGPDWGRGLLGQGGLALALALDYSQRSYAPLASIVFTGAIASVLLTDLSSAHLVRSVLAPLFGDEKPPRSSPATTEAVEPSPASPATPG